MPFGAELWPPNFVRPERVFGIIDSLPLIVLTKSRSAAVRACVQVCNR